MRFSHDNLFEIIRQLWPMIYADLVLRLTSNKNVDVLFSVLKFIDFLSVVNNEYFSLFQWAFLQDTNDITRLRLNENPAVLKKTNCFRPFAMRFFLDDYEFDMEFKKILEKYRDDSSKAKLKSLVLKIPKVRFNLIIK